MKLVIGLGNPGNKYANTRHNVGYMVLDKLAETLGATEFKLNKQGNFLSTEVELGGERVILIKPQGFMNNSGISVLHAKNKHKSVKLSGMFVIHDDLDIKLGEYKIQLGKGPKVHNGLNDIYGKIYSKDFWHVRVGIDNRDSTLRTPGNIYVLQDFSDDEIQLTQQSIRDLIAHLMARF